jgi:hypothetical protein
MFIPPSKDSFLKLTEKELNYSGIKTNIYLPGHYSSAHILAYFNARKHNFL